MSQADRDGASHVGPSTEPAREARAGGAERLLWRAYARVYDRLWDTPAIDELAEAVIAQLDPALPVHEVGAGTGLVSERLWRRGLLASASEPQADMRRRLLGRLPAELVSDAGVEGCAADGRDRNVVAVNVVHVLADPGEGVRRLRAHAGPGGRVVLVTPRPGSTVLSAARVQRRAGASRRHGVRFVLLHLLLAPLVLAASAGVAARSPLDEAFAEVEQELSATSRLLMAPGRANEHEQASTYTSFECVEPPPSPA